MAANTTYKASPRIARWVIRSLFADQSDTKLGDFEEMYNEVIQKKGAFKALWWYMLYILHSIPPLTENYFYRSYGMFKNYFKVAVRNIVKQKIYSLINISGLTIGITCSVLLAALVHYDLTFDNFHENGEQLYRVISDMPFEQKTNWAITQGPLAPALKEAFPEIIDAVKASSSALTLTYKDKNFRERLLFTGPSFLKMFSFPVLQGNTEVLFPDKYSMVMTQTLAEKYFGNDNPVGQIVNVNDRYDVRVTAVIADVPENSHIQFDFLMGMDVARDLGYSVDLWNNSQFLTYVMTAEGVDRRALDQKIAGFLDDKPTLEDGAKLWLQPVKDIYLHSAGIDYNIAQQGDIKYVYLFSLVAFFILVIACINFMNLSTARSAKRALEVGVRKVVGAYRKDIIKQFFSESLLLTGISLVIALVLVNTLLPFLNDLSGRALEFNIFKDATLLFGLIGITLFTGIIAGSYPALFLSSFRPIKVLKSQHDGDERGSFLRKSLVVLQFSLSIMLIIGSLIVFEQVRYMESKDIGFDKENLVYLRIDGLDESEYRTLKNEFGTHKDITGTTASAMLPTWGFLFTNNLWKWEGQQEGEKLLMHGVSVAENYFDVFKMDILLGQTFTRAVEGNSADFIVNEEAVRRMNMQSPIGKALSVGETSGKIIGVVKDYNFRSLHSGITPLVLYNDTNALNYIILRISPQNVSETVAFIETTWKTLAGDRPFSFGFLDDSLNSMYFTEQRTGQILRYFTMLGIFISCLGLFGLASFIAENRRKEIGIRKVLGASTKGIIYHLSKNFIAWVIIANAIAWPVAYFGVSNWLANFAYRMQIGWSVFILSGLAALTIAILTVAFQVIKAALSNPVESLKYE